MCVYGYGYVHTSVAQVPLDLSGPRAGITGGCKRPVVGVGDQSAVCVSSTLSTAEHFLRPCVFLTNERTFCISGYNSAVLFLFWLSRQGFSL